MISEFDIIHRYFSFSENQTSDITLAVGDDAAVVTLSNANLVVATDTLIEGVHFPVDFAAKHVATRAIGVNLSDFAAMGAHARWVTMALALPQAYANEAWLAEFGQSFKSCCDKYHIALIGGDTTRSEQLTITLTVMGEPYALPTRPTLPVKAPVQTASSHTTSVQTTSSHKTLANQAGNVLVRSGAKVGDDVWVSGTLGHGGAALAVLKEPDLRAHIEQSAPVELNQLLNSFYAPEPRLKLGQHLLNIASSAIDISDGLLADAGHIAQQSSVCLTFNTSLLPVHPAIHAMEQTEVQEQWLLSGGDEYELLFTASPEFNNAIKQLATSCDLRCTNIGSVEHGEGVLVNGQVIDGVMAKKDSVGYRHF